MEYLGIMGFSMAGFILPELLKVLGNSDNVHTHIPLNILSAFSAGFIATPFLTK